MPQGYGYRSEQRLRKENQDNFGIFPQPGWTLLVLCDGMGGHVGGRQASAIAVRAIHDHLVGLSRDLSRDPSGEDARAALVAAIEAANTAIYEAQVKDYRLAGMGTTVVAAVIVGDAAHIAHVGDSRALLLRDGTIRRLTRDHTMVNLFIDAQFLSEEDAATHPQANVLERSLGVQRTVKVDLGEPLALGPRDRLLLCSDGVHGVLDEATLAAIDWASPSAGCSAVADAVADKNGDDNATILAFATAADGVSPPLPGLPEVVEPEGLDPEVAPVGISRFGDDVTEDVAPVEEIDDLVAHEAPAPSPNRPPPPAALAAKPPAAPGRKTATPRGPSRLALVAGAAMAVVGAAAAAVVVWGPPGGPTPASPRTPAPAPAAMEAPAPSEARATASADAGASSPSPSTPPAATDPAAQSVPPGSDLATDEGAAVASAVAAAEAAQQGEGQDDGGLPDGLGTPAEGAAAPAETVPPAAPSAPPAAPSAPPAARPLPPSCLACSGSWAPLAATFYQEEDADLLAGTLYAPRLPEPPPRLPHSPARYSATPPGGAVQAAIVTASRQGDCAAALDRVVREVAAVPAYAPLLRLAWRCTTDNHSQPLERTVAASWSDFSSLLPHFEGTAPDRRPLPPDQPAPGGVEHRLSAFDERAAVRDVALDLLGAGAVADDLGADLLFEATAAAGIAALTDPSPAAVRAWARRVYVLERALGGEVGRLVRAQRADLHAAVRQLLSDATGGAAGAVAGPDGYNASIPPAVAAAQLMAAGKPLPDALLKGLQDAGAGAATIDPESGLPNVPWVPTPTVERKPGAPVEATPTTARRGGSGGTARRAPAPEPAEEEPGGIRVYKVQKDVPTKSNE